MRKRRKASYQKFYEQAIRTGTREVAKPKKQSRSKRKKTPRTESNAGSAKLSAETLKLRGKTIHTYAIVRNHPYNEPAFRTAIYAKYTTLAQAKNELLRCWGIAPENLSSQTSVDLRCIVNVRTFTHLHVEYITPVDMTDEQVKAAVKKGSTHAQKDEEEE